jgi:putative AlgH/UPF0301 family transcriptional regulator
MNFTIIDNPNQREREIIDNSWFVVKASPNLEISRQEESNSGMNFMIIDKSKSETERSCHSPQDIIK